MSTIHQYIYLHFLDIIYDIKNNLVSYVILFFISYGNYAFAGCYNIKKKKKSKSYLVHPYLMVQNRN